MTVNGVSAIVTVTTPATKAVSEGQSARTADADAKRTKANSPACGSSRAIRTASLWLERKRRASP